MKRRELLKATGLAVVGMSTFPLGWVAAADKKRQKVLYFTRSVGFEHDAVKPRGTQPSYSEKALTEMGQRAGFEIEATKDGKVFDGDLGQYDLIAFYTTGDLTRPAPSQPGSPMSPEGKKKLLDAIAAGKGFVGFHSATDSFHSRGIDPYIAMIGSEFVVHGQQQVAKLSVASPKFPGIGDYKFLEMNEEWYTLSKFAKDLHVILVQETEGMKDDCYQRPPFPATWARMHQKGRVYYTSFGHREDVWNNPKVQEVILGGIAWAMGNVNADVTPNIDKVTPKANQLKN
jgi:type 1 glutamine amidotransferase